MSKPACVRVSFINVDAFEQVCKSLPKLRPSFKYKTMSFPLFLQYFTVCLRHFVKMHGADIKPKGKTFETVKLILQTK